MKYAKITFIGVNSPSGVQPAGNYIHGPMPSALRPFYASFLFSSEAPYSPGYYIRNTFPPDLTTDQNSLSYYVLRYSPNDAYTGGSSIILEGGFYDKDAALYEGGWEVFNGVSALPGATTFTNNVSGASGTATIDLLDDTRYPTDAQKSPLTGPDFVWGWDGFIWRWIEPTETPYADILATGGGRYHQSVVAIAHGQIYYGNIT